MTQVTIGVGEDGQVVHASANDTVVLRLPENPTTGVRWDFESLEDEVDLVGDTYEQPAGSGVGAATTRVFSLKLPTPGRFELKLKRWQEWEGASSIDATFSCTLAVEDGSG